MKIWNLILLNLCFLQHFSMLFGMNPVTEQRRIVSIIMEK